MAGSGKGKHGKGKGKSKVRKSNYTEQPRTSASNSNMDRKKDMNEEKGPDSDILLNADMMSWKNRSEEELEKLLFSEIDSIYVEAFHNLLAFGYAGGVAQKAIMMNGHAFGSMNILSNIVINSYSYINSGSVTDGLSGGKSKNWSERVHELLEISVRAAQEYQPGCSRYDAIKRILEINAHVGVGSIMNLQSLETEDNIENLVDGLFSDNTQITNDPSAEKIDAPLQKELYLPKRFELKPGMKSLLRKNVETIAAMYHSQLDASPTYAEALHYSLSSKGPDMEDLDILKLVGCSENLSIEEWLQRSGEDPRNELILSLVKDHEKLKGQVVEHKEWALDKARQADKRLSRHISELRMLRMEKLKNEVMKINKENSLKKKEKVMLDTENALWNSLSQLELSTAAIKQLEMQNSNTRADIEAHNLSSSLTHRALLQVEKREKKCLKRAAAMEKERDQIQEHVEKHKQEVFQLNQELLQLHNNEKEAKGKLKETLKEKELAIALVAEEDMLRKEAEANLRSKRESLHKKLESSCQPLRDNMHRLRAELASPQNPELNAFEFAPPECYVLRDCDDDDEEEEEVSYGRECIICWKKEVSVLFLPCAHQVVCSECNEDKTMENACPCCQSRIEERIRICGASSRS